MSMPAWRLLRLDRRGGRLGLIEGRLRLVVGAAHRSLEPAQRLAEPVPELGELLGAEKQDQQRADEDHFSSSQAEHGPSMAGSAPRSKRHVGPDQWGARDGAEWVAERSAV